jgi:hypothetical protein
MQPMNLSGTSGTQMTGSSGSDCTDEHTVAISASANNAVTNDDSNDSDDASNAVTESTAHRCKGDAELLLEVQDGAVKTVVDSHLRLPSELTLRDADVGAASRRVVGRRRHELQLALSTSHLQRTADNRACYQEAMHTYYTHSLTAAMPPHAAQHSTAQHSTAQHSTAQHSTAQHSTAQHSTAQHTRDEHTHGTQTRRRAPWR